MHINLTGNGRSEPKGDVRNLRYLGILETSESLQARYRKLNRFLPLPGEIAQQTARLPLGRNQVHEAECGRRVASAARVPIDAK